MSTIHPKPFTNIAISLSGGGYRAATFHLGALSLLNEVTFSYAGEDSKSLLQNVSTLSTVSGGTIVGALYALHAARGQSFEICFKKLYQLLEKDELLEEAFEKLKSTSEWTAQSRNTNLINAFAEVYDAKYYERLTFQTLLDDSTSHLRDVIFNATEFTNSLHFRFQTEGIFGNGKIKIPKEVAREIRIADAVAASSCFPMGFEPMEIPRDFSNGTNSKINEHWKAKEYSNTALMDGGIVDNQGIDSVLKAEGRNKRRNEKKEKIPYTGTFIISDVSGGSKPFELPTYDVRPNKLSLKLFNLIMIFISIIGLGTLAYSYNLGTYNLGISLCLFVTILALSYLALFYFLWGKLKGIVKGIIGNENLLNLSSLRIIKIVPVYILKYLVMYRVTSTVKMVESIFMKRIRDLQINSLYQNKNWNYRIKNNNIYTLKGNTDSYLGTKLPPIIAYANSMGTTLWFTEEEKEKRMLDKLIICGQFTLCYNLIDYMETYKEGPLYEILSKEDKTALDSLYLQLTDLQNNFIHNPHWLIEKVKQGKNLEKIVRTSLHSFFAGFEEKNNLIAKRTKKDLQTSYKNLGGEINIDQIIPSMEEAGIITSNENSISLNEKYRVRMGEFLYEGQSFKSLNTAIGDLIAKEKEGVS